MPKALLAKAFHLQRSVKEMVKEWIGLVKQNKKQMGASYDNNAKSRRRLKIYCLEN